MEDHPRLAQALDRLPTGGQSKIAKTIGVSRQTLSAMRKRRQEIGDHAAALSAALGVSERWLIYGEGEAPLWANPPVQPVDTAKILEEIQKLRAEVAELRAEKTERGRIALEEDTDKHLAEGESIVQGSPELRVR